MHGAVTRLQTHLSGFASNDQDADIGHHVDLGRFLESVEKQAYVIALSACQDSQVALDIVQDAMFSMVKSYGNKPASEWRPLFFKVLSNRITDHHRKRGFSRLTRWFGDQGGQGELPEDVVDQLPSTEIDPVRYADSLDLNETVAAAIAELSQKQQQALLLRLWMGFSVKETAKVMGISEGSVKTHLSRAVSEMRLSLNEFYSHE